MSHIISFVGQHPLNASVQRCARPLAEHHAARWSVGNMMDSSRLHMTATGALSQLVSMTTAAVQRSARPLSEHYSARRSVLRYDGQFPPP